MGIIFMVDMQSFYASVEKAKRPELHDKPVVVAGDPKRRSGVVLAACPIAKKQGVANAERLWEAQQKCPEAIILKPHMQEYINVSLQITEILERYTDLVEPFSIDEQFMDVTGSQKLFGTPFEMARKIQKQIWKETKVYARVGIGENKILAKMACDNFAKKNKNGIFWLRKEELAETLWLLPIEKMFGIGSRMASHLRNMGIRTIGQFATTPLERFKKRWGINGHVLWMTSHGIDYSPVTTRSHDRQKAIGHGMTLPRDYADYHEISIVLRELCEEVCRRARKSGVMGSTVSVSVGGANYMIRTGFHRQTTLYEPTNITKEVYIAADSLFSMFWDGLPIRRLAVNLSNLCSDQEIQLSLFDQDKEKKIELGYVMDSLRDRFGSTAIIYASSFTKAGQALDRAKKIGGHYK